MNKTYQMPPPAMHKELSNFIKSWFPQTQFEKKKSLLQ